MEEIQFFKSSKEAIHQQNHLMLQHSLPNNYLIQNNYQQQHIRKMDTKSTVPMSSSISASNDSTNGTNKLLSMKNFLARKEAGHKQKHVTVKHSLSDKFLVHNNHQQQDTTREDNKTTVINPRSVASTISASNDPTYGKNKLTSMKNFLPSNTSNKIDGDSLCDSNSVLLSDRRSFSPHKVALAQNTQSKFMDFTEYLQTSKNPQLNTLDYSNNQSNFRNDNNKMYLIDENLKDPLFITPHNEFDVNEDKLIVQQDQEEQLLSPFVTKTLNGTNSNFILDSNLCDEDSIPYFEEHIGSSSSNDDELEFYKANYSDQRVIDIENDSDIKVYSKDGNSVLDSEDKAKLMKYTPCLDNHRLHEKTLFIRKQAFNLTNGLVLKDVASILDLDTSNEFNLESPTEPPSVDVNDYISNNETYHTVDLTKHREISRYQEDRSKYYMCDTCVFKSRSIQDIREHVKKFNDQGIPCTFTEFGLEGAVNTNYRAEQGFEDCFKGIRFVPQLKGANSCTVTIEDYISEERGNIRLKFNAKTEPMYNPDSFIRFTYQCDSCPYECNEENDLKLHILKHTIPKTSLGPYRRRHNNKTKYFSQKYKLNKTKVCAVQNKNFAQKWNKNT
ncbi:unnamed protein product, partial [Meganyctiphanes norvegica]